jgi:hypothetical protein
MDIPVSKVRDFELEYTHYLRLHHGEELNSLKKGILTDDITKLLEKTAKDLVKKYVPNE